MIAGIWNNFVKLGRPIVARALLAVPANVVRRAVRRDRVAGWDERAQGFRAAVVGLLAHRWVRITTATRLSHYSLYLSWYLVLLVALRQVGVSEDEVSWTRRRWLAAGRNAGEPIAEAGE